jgi:carbon storage regulator
MLTLTRRAGQRLVIGNDVEVEVVSVTGGRVKLGIRAPREIPIHRGELVDRVAEEIQRASRARAAENTLPTPRPEDVITIPEGFFGLRSETRWVIYELGDPSPDWPAPVRALVSADTPTLRLLIVEAGAVDDAYPAERARDAAALGDSEVAVALVVTAPADGSPATVNCAAPIVLGLRSRRGAQVLLDDPQLDVHRPFLGEKAR